jgi:hypothetical protein
MIHNHYKCEKMPPCFFRIVELHLYMYIIVQLPFSVINVIKYIDRDPKIYGLTNISIEVHRV